MHKDLKNEMDACDVCGAHVESKDAFSVSGYVACTKKCFKSLVSKVRKKEDEKKNQSKARAVPSLSCNPGSAY